MAIRTEWILKSPWMDSLVHGHPPRTYSIYLLTMAHMSFCLYEKSPLVINHGLLENHTVDGVPISIAIDFGDFPTSHAADSCRVSHYTLRHSPTTMGIFIHIDPEGHQFLVETHLPSPKKTGRVYVNLLEGISNFCFDKYHHCPVN